MKTKTFKQFQIEHAPMPKPKKDMEWQDFAKQVIDDIEYLNLQHQVLQKEFVILQDEFIDQKSRQ